MKYFLGGALFVIALGVVVFAIRHESHEIQNAVKSSVDQGVDREIDKVIDKGPQVLERTVDSASETIGKVLRPRESNEGEPKAPEDRKSEDSQAKESKPQGPQAKDPRKTTTDPIGLVDDVIGLAREATKAADDVGQGLFALDLDQECEVGREVHRMILKDHRVLRLPEQQLRVEQLAKPILNLCKRKGLTYTFWLIDDKEVNAFSHLGGYIYIHKGLLDFAASDVELQYVLGHEIAHVELKHCVRNLTYAAHLSKWTPDAVVGVAQAAYQLIAVGYSKDSEFEADAWSFRTQIRLGRSREQATSFARHYLDYLTGRGIETESPQPKSAPDAVVHEIENHFRTHPAPRERLRRLEKLSTNADKP